MMWHIDQFHDTHVCLSASVNNAIIRITQYKTEKESERLSNYLTFRQFAEAIAITHAVICKNVGIPDQKSFYN